MFDATLAELKFDEMASSFQSSSPVLNGIWTMCKRGVQMGYQEVIVDCPTREKALVVRRSE